MTNLPGDVGREAPKSLIDMKRQKVRDFATDHLKGANEKRFNSMVNMSTKQRKTPMADFNLMLGHGNIDKQSWVNHFDKNEFRRRNPKKP